MTRKEQTEKEARNYAYHNGGNYEELENCNDVKIAVSIIEIAKMSFAKGAKWADRTMIEKVVNWLVENIVDGDYIGMNSTLHKNELIKNIKKIMEE